MKTFLVLVMILASSQAAQQPSARPMPQSKVVVSQKLVHQIQKNNPKISKQYARTLASLIEKKSKKHNVSPKVLAAMLMQESAYNISAKNIRCGVSLTTGNKDCVVIDYGIGQINYKTIKHFKFDETKLVSNLEYSVEAAAIVLADFKRMYGHKDQEYWTRYNASTPAKRQAYKILVARYM